jgi:hypothetical protein
MALLATGSALVAGGFLEKEMQTVHVKVLRSFYFGGLPTKVDTVRLGDVRGE